MFFTCEMTCEIFVTEISLSFVTFLVISLIFQVCDKILTELWASDNSFPFARPVDSKKVCKCSMLYYIKPIPAGNLK